LEGQDSQPRRLQVNAFGFGGSNYVVQVEQAMDEVDTILVSPAENPISIERKVTAFRISDFGLRIEGSAQFRWRRQGAELPELQWRLFLPD